MAGSFASLKVEGADNLAVMLNKYLKQGNDLTTPLRESGEFLLESTQERFRDMQAPDGEPWEPLSPKTLKHKKRPDKILTETGTLADTLNYLVSGNSLELGSNMEYAATHQFGRDDIPARPFLGFAPFEEKEVLDIFRDHLENN